MNNQPIGILDSGVGGLSIWKEIVKELPNESTIYLADSLNCPYGDRTEEEIYSLAKRLVQFLLEKKVKLIVLACNTITVFCLDKVRSEFPEVPIVGTVPAVKTAVEKTKNKKIGILSTTATANSRYQKDLIAKFVKGCKALNIGTNLLVPFVEKGETESEEVKKVVRQALKEFLIEGVDTIALGCSHFPFLRGLIEEIMGEKIKVVDSGVAVSRQVKRVLTNNKILSLSNSPSYTFYTTGDAKEFTRVSKELVGDDFGDLIKLVQYITFHSNDLYH